MQFPGLAPGQEQALIDAEMARALGWFGPARIGLVPASRPADVLALVGYNGTVNRYGTPEELSVALRSWEDRFGAALVEVGFAHIRLLARRPPRTLRDAQAVAPDWPTGIALGAGGLAGAYTGARLQSRMPDVMIRRLVGVLVVAIGARYLRSGLS